MDEDAVPSKPKSPFRKGALVRLNLKAYQNSLESNASDQILPEYILQGPGELIVIKGEYGQVRWQRPVPDVWLRIDQLEAWPSIFEQGIICDRKKTLKQNIESI